MVRRSTFLAIALAALVPSGARGADFGFFGRSADAIEIDLEAPVGVPSRSTFGGLDLSGGWHAQGGLPTWAW